MYAGLGCLLVLANVWFVSSVRRAFHPTEFVLAPFQVLGRDARDESYGSTLARMLDVRLANLQRELRRAHESGSRTERSDRREEAARAAAEPAATLLILPQPVDVPTQFLQTVDVQVSVGGVEVGGILPWLQSAISRNRTLTFTVLDKGETAEVSADLTGFAAGSDPSLLFESRTDAGEVVTNAAYGLVQKRIEAVDSPLASLDLADFRTLLTSIFEVERLNRRVRQGHVLASEFAALLEPLESIGREIPQWHELTYLIANVADSAGNREKAIEHARRLSLAAGGEGPGPPQELVSWARESLRTWGVAEVGGEAERRFARVARDFGQRMGLAGADPGIVFKEPEHEGIQALWREETRTYEVNPRFIDTPGLPQYVALMGRFLAANYGRCFEDGSGPPVGFWNGFRHAVVDYLIQSIPEFSDVQLMTWLPESRNLFDSLKRLEREDPEPVRRLALDLLQRFECDWRFENLRDRVLAINDERGYLPRERIEADFRPEPDAG